MSPSCHRVWPAVFGYVAVLPDAVHWCRVAVLAHADMVDEKDYVVGQICYADGVKKAGVAKLAEKAVASRSGGCTNSIFFKGRRNKAFAMASISKRRGWG